MLSGIGLACAANLVVSLLVVPSLASDQARARDNTTCLCVCVRVCFPTGTAVHMKTAGWCNHTGTRAVCSGVVVGPRA
jgi:hypothetical protein